MSADREGVMADSDIVAKINPDGNEWEIEVRARSEIALRAGVKKRRAEVVFKVGGFETVEDAEAEIDAVLSRAEKIKSFW